MDHGLNRLEIIVADGRSGRNRNHELAREQSLMIVADGRSGRNRNLDHGLNRLEIIVADGRSGRNRNYHLEVVLGPTL